MGIDRDATMLRGIKKYLDRQGLPLVLSVPLGLLCALMLYCTLGLPQIYDRFLQGQSTALRNTFMLEGIAGLVRTLVGVGGVAVIVFFMGMIVGMIRKGWALRILRACYNAAYLFFLLYVFAIIRVTDLIFANNLKVYDVLPVPVMLFYWRLDLLWPAVAIAVVIAVLQVISWRRVTIDWYTGYHEEAAAPGDRIIENLRTHGPDPKFRKSLIHSSLIHFTVIVVIPYLLTVRGCVEPYRVPGEGGGGSGVINPVVGYIKKVNPKKRPPKHYVLNPNSSIAFYVPDLNDTTLNVAVDKETQETYEADVAGALQSASAGGGRPGQGDGAGYGWPGGMKNAVVRFIRLEYDGENWNDGMDFASRSDLNFLDEFKRETGFKVANSTEAVRINQLNRFQKGFAPPFLFMTGSSAIRIPQSDMNLLQKYLMEGGMLIADASTPAWDRNFRVFLQALLPGQPLLVVADDDPIYQYPHVFPNGAPPLWHHGGNRSMGIRSRGRWIVYYHPGDMHDAWKTGHSGLDPVLAKHAMQLGVNLVYYAFTQYLNETRKLRK